MRLPVIKHLNKFISEYDQDYAEEAMELLEYLSDSNHVKDEELDVIGELMSNIAGAVEVNRMIREDGLSEKEALNTFMKRVTGSIDQ